MVLCIEPTSSLLTQPAKRTNEFSNQTCVFIRLPTSSLLTEPAAKRTNKFSNQTCVFIQLPTSSLFTQPAAKRTDEFSNQTCVFIRPTCLMLGLNKKFKAALTQYSLHQCRYSQIKESITENIDTNHFKNWLKYLFVCN